MSDPAPEPVENTPGGSTDWGEMTPGQRVTFIQYARERGDVPCGSFSYFSSEPPQLCQADPEPSSPTGSLFGVSSPLPGQQNLWLWLALGLLLLAVVAYAGGKAARRFAPI